jgi:putative colanic acid biosynthesis UDP-glucose lipid carrier transferase
MSKIGAEYIGSPAKRRLDRYGGLAIAAALTPLAIPIAAAVDYDHRITNPLFVQQRVGKNGQTITVRKFQTLRETDNTENLYGGAQHPGASPLGLALRKRGLDEIPQILSVIKGDISLVGIRPIPQVYRDYYASFVPTELFSQWDEISQLNPGLTGVGQLYGKQFPKHTPDIVQRQIELEVAAFDTASLANDLRTIAVTPLILMGQRLDVPSLSNVPESA